MSINRKIHLLLAEFLLGVLLFATCILSNPRLTQGQQVAAVIPPQIQAFTLQELDGVTLQAAVDAGMPYTLSLGGQSYTLLLTPTSVQAPGLSLPGYRSFRGQVAGAPASRVRLSVREGLISGSIWLAPEWYWIEPVANFGDPRTLGVPSTLHVLYKASDVAVHFDLSHDVVPSSESSSEAPLGPSSTPERQCEWVEATRSQTAILYTNSTQPGHKRGEFGHAFTWDALTETWAPYALTQGTGGEYRVNVSSGSYVVSPQGVQLVDHTGAPQVRAAEWQVTRWDTITATWTPVNFPSVQVTDERTAEALWITRTWTGA